MIIRKSVHSLSGAEKATFVRALLELKRRGRYDDYVHWHHHVMVPSVLPFEPRDANYRNGAHRGPAFLPWHREFLMQVEADLRSMTSPNDPVFFLHHCFVDKVWADWQEVQKKNNPDGAPITRRFAMALRVTISVTS